MKRIMLVLVVLISGVEAFGQPADEPGRKRLIEVAFKYQGVPYVYGAE